MLQKISQRIKWHSLQIKDFFAQRQCHFPAILSQSDSIRLAAEKKMSISRFGDGELSLMCGKDLNFQTYDKLLAEKMERVISNDNPSVLVCLPDCFSSNSLSRLCATDKSFWKTHLYFFRKEWCRRLDPEKTYGNTWLSRIYSMKWDVMEANAIFAELETLWKDRRIVIIEGEYSRLGVGNDCFSGAADIRRIIGPAKNAFSRYNDLVDAAMSVEKDALMVLALGPTATAMVGDLSDAGYQAIDLGHLDIEYEWMRMKALSKLPVRGKFSNEAFLTGQSAQEVSGSLTDEEYSAYKSQIIASFL